MGFLIFSLLIGLLTGWYFTRQYLKGKYEEEISARQADIERQIKECENLKQDIIYEAEDSKRKSKNILAKAVDCAFNFERDFLNQHKTAQVEIQKVLDDTYRYKRKTLLSSLTLKNFEKKFDDIKKEREIYTTLIAKYDFFALKDNSDWNEVEKEFREKVLLLQEAQDEREAQNEIKRQMREEQQRAAELEKRQLEAEAKEQELEGRRRAVEEALLAADAEHRTQLEETRRQLEQEIADVHKQYERSKSMAQLTKQGYVYIISNIGSFGDGVYKVGMTRRLEPLDRVAELGDASVPFEFDVHAMISCDDAPALEAALHNALSDNRMNRVNLRKEFFRVDLGKIISCVEDHHGKIEYFAEPAAIQYYRSLEIENNLREED